MKNTLSLLLAVACLSLSSMSFAAHPLATDDAGTTGMKKFQVETSAEIGWDKETDRDITTKVKYQKLNVALTAGVLGSLDLALSYPFTWQHSVQKNN